MKGLELSRAYYEEYGKPMIDTQLAQYKPYLAAGLVGEGSECLGFDDELSTDHDFAGILSVGAGGTLREGRYRDAAGIR